MESNIFWIVYSISFLIALTGAMSPGPLLTYTIIKSIQAKKHGFLMGVWIVFGHAILELILIILILAGLSWFLLSTTTVKVIGILGGTFLIIFGLLLGKDLKNDKIPTDFLRKNNNIEKIEKNKEEIEKKEKLNKENQKDSALPQFIDHPIAGGIFVSMSNPYWWVWWVTIGLSLMLQYNVSFNQPTGFIAFFFGHETGDLAWYLIVSIMADLGRKALNKELYYGILWFCAIFMVGFGIYLGISPFI